MPLTMRCAIASSSNYFATALNRITL